MFPPRLLGLLEEALEAPSPGDRLVRVATTVEPETPQRFLSRAEQAPRAFWQMGDAWRAGVGAAYTLHIPPGSGPERFTRIRDEAARIQEQIIEAPEDDDLSPLSLVGGFSFHDTPEPDPAWAPFGAARFTVPALEMQRTPNGTRLIGTARVPKSQDPETALDQARRALEAAVDELTAPAPTGPHEYQIPTPAGTTDQETWSNAVEEALDRIVKGEFRKVVLARHLDLEAGTDPAPDPAIILGNLRQGNPGTNLFLLEPEPGHAFLGAAPELIANVRGSTFQANAVAGSIARGTSEDEDDELARELAASAKNRDEHTIVVDSMRQRLAGLTDHVEVARETSILRLAGIQHLERDLYARLAPDQHVLDLLAELHPTPAVCGYPRDPARRFLRRVEPFERGWYAGPVGWFDVEGDGAFAPGLRSAVLDEARWRLFAGAGIVPGSEPEAEYEETRIKLEPALNALGLQEAPP